MNTRPGGPGAAVGRPAPGTVCGMANITRRQREARAYQLTLATGGGAVATVVLAVVALFTSLSFGIVVLAALFTVVCAVLLRRVFQR